MCAEGLLVDLDKLPFISVKDGIVTKVSQRLVNITQFANEEFLNRDVEEIFRILRVGPNINLNSIDEEADYFLFTKSLEVKQVSIKVIENRKEKVFVFLENPDFNLENKFPQVNRIFLDNYQGVAVFSLPDITLLKANETFISFFDKPFNQKENCIGRRVSEFVTDFEGSSSEKIWQDIINTGQTYYTEEYMFDRLERGITYWKSTLTPISEDGKLTYCIEITKEVTEEVKLRKEKEEQARIIKEQNEQLKWQASLLSLCTEAIFAWNLEGGIMYWNKGAEQLYGYSSEEALGCDSHALLRTMLPFSKENFETMLKNEGIWRGIIEQTRKDGTKLIISTCQQIITDDDGKQIILETNRDITSEKRMEDELKQQKAALEEIIQNIDDAVYIYDGNKNFYLVNNAGKELFRGSQFTDFDELNNNTPYKYYDENGNEITADNLVVSRAMRGEVVTNYKMTFKNSLESKHYSVNGRPVYDKDGNIRFVVISCRNITKDVDTQREIEQQKRLLEAAIESMNDAIAFYDGKGNILLTNAEARRMYPTISSKTTVGNVHYGYELFDMDNNSIPFDNLPTRRVFKGEKIRNERIKVKYLDMSRVVEVNAVPVYDSCNNLLSVIISHKDVTQNVEYEAKLKQQKELLETVLENMNDAIIVFDKQRNPVLLNAEARKMYPNMAASSLKGVHEDYQFSDLEGNVLSFEDLGSSRAYRGEIVRNDRMVVDGEGKHQILRVNISPIFDENKNVELIVLCHSDITEQINQHQLLLDAEREKSEAMERAIEMKDEFLSLISHEFRTPLNVINTAIQAINYFCINDLPEKAKKYLNMIRINTFRQLRLVNNLLDITRADAGRMKINKKNLDIVFLTKAIIESVQVYASQKGIKLELSSSFKERIIGIDEEKYERILLNLLSNAIKFTPEGKSVNVKLSSKKNNICIEVKDEGIGIPKDKRDIIFDRFGQVDSSLSRQAEGSGIGLSLVKKLIEALGGSVSVKSTLGKGSTFIILLPNNTVACEEEQNDIGDLMDNRLVHVTNVEFSDIYL